MGRRSLQVRVSGRVQGVGFRAWTQRQAERLGVSGWVRNTAEGKVEAVLCGEEAAVEAMLAALRDGPAAARVDALTVTGEVAAAAGGFAIRRDG